MTPQRASLAIAVVGAVFLGGRGLWVFLQDASYFLDAASVVASLERLSLLETFVGPLETGHSFPRVYLALIRGLRALLGHETWVTRLLPHAAYLAATALWMRLLVVRFGPAPLFVLFGVILAAMAPSWWTYGAVVKQYSLDTMVVVALFSVPDASLDETLQARRRLWRIPLLVAPVLLSYTYGPALLARVLGWALLRWRNGRLPDLRPSAMFTALLVASLGLLFHTDIRHTTGQAALVRVWEACVASQQPPGAWPELLRRFVASWYVGPTEFFFPPKMQPVAVWVLFAAEGLGVARAVASLFSPSVSTNARWGSRSLGCVAALAGAIGASFVLDYPICAGRSTLYLLPLHQILVLEGLQWIWQAARSARIPAPFARFARLAALLALVALVAVGALHALRVHQHLARGLPLENLRPLLPRVREDPALPVLVTPCARRQMETLPDDLDGLDLRFLPVSDWQSLVPRGQEVWIIHSRLNPGFCERFRRQLRNMTHGFDRPDRRGEDVVVYRATTRSQAELRAQRKRSLRALKAAADARDDAPEPSP